MRYTDFSLLWTNFGGYADREEPFGVPTTVCMISKGDRACCLKNWRESVTANEVRNLAAWQEVSTEMLRELRDALSTIGVFDEIQPLIETDGDGPYFVSWEFTGADAGRPFHFCVEWTTPGEVWTPQGEHFRNVIKTMENLRDTPAA